MTQRNARRGMTRRHFMSHLASASALAAPAFHFTSTLAANAAELKKNEKAAILIWLGGGPASIDMWDLKPGSPGGGPFKPIATTGDMQICEHLPQMAKLMKHLSIVRSMSTREADHTRGRYYLHTGKIPLPGVEHPSYGAVVAHEKASQLESLEIPPFVSIGGSSIGPGFFGMPYAPFVVSTSGKVANLDMGVDASRTRDRRKMLASLESGFIHESGSLAAKEHSQMLDKTFALMTSQQMDAFKIEREPQSVRDRYGASSLGRGCLMARRLVEVGVPFVEVEFGGWDTHSDNFERMKTQNLPRLDQAFSALVSDLVDRGMWKNVTVFCMGEFGRTPTINGNSGRDHWARSWSAVLGGGALNNGIVVGSTNADGSVVASDPQSAENLMATVLQSLDISLDKWFTTPRGRPMKIAGGGEPIRELFA